MSNPKENSHLEELAALHGAGLLDEHGQRELFSAAAADPAVERMMKEMLEAAANLSYEATEMAPPAELKARIMGQLAARGEARAQGGATNILHVSQWIPFAIAACLMLLGIGETRKILDLQGELAATRDDAARLRSSLNASNAMAGMKLATLDAKDAAYSAARVLVAWDPYRSRGVVTAQNLPAAAAGHDYQLWVLDPTAEAPISAGVMPGSANGQRFVTHRVGTTGPGFAVSLEPSGGSPEPTGPILFAVAPGQ